VPAQCVSCGAPLAVDQRYCLECGERRSPVNGAPFGGPPDGDAETQAPRTPAQPSLTTPTGGAGQHGSTPTVLAGVGVLLLAMGVGVLIGRSGATKQTTAPASQVITQVAPSSASVSPTESSQASFNEDWPSGTNGYTVQLQALPQAGTAVSAVEAAKKAALSKGAKAVGALKTEEFSNLASGNYVIYSGVYHNEVDAVKALGTLKRIFPSAKVLALTNRSSAAAKSASGGSRAPSSEKHPAPPSVLEGLNTAKGKSYEEKSKNLPDVVSTG
jgi:hypothetical protein